MTLGTVSGWGVGEEYNNPCCTHSTPLTHPNTQVPLILRVCAELVGKIDTLLNRTSVGPISPS